MASEEVTPLNVSAVNGREIAAPQSYLAKVYTLGENDQAWQDCGVVRVRCGFVESLNETALVMLPEDEPTRVVLETPLSQCEFRRDVPTIISWVDSLEQFRPSSEFAANPQGTLHEVALSFETSEGCARIWEEIQTVLGRVVGEYRIEEFRNGQGDHDDAGAYGYDPSQLSHDSGEGHAGMNSMLQNLPPFTRSNLASYVQTLGKFSPAFRARFGHELAHSNGGNGRNGEGPRLSLKAVFEMFDEVENDASTESQAHRTEELHLIFELIKYIALLDDRRILETLVEDEYFERLAGCFEYDPTLAVRPNHRRFLREEVRLVQVVPMTNPRIVNMISHRFRLIFLRDVLLARVTDEMSQKRLSGFEKQLGGDITQMLTQDKEFVSRLFELLEGPAQPERSKAIELMLELCKPTIDMQMPARNAIYRTFLENDRVLHVTERLMSDPTSSARERIDIQEVLFFFLKHDPAMLREYILGCEKRDTAEDKSKSCTLLGLLVDAVVDCAHAGVPAQAAKLLMTLLDPESFVASAAHSEHNDDPFITTFYNKYFARLLAVLENPAVVADTTPEDPAHLVCDLILYFIQNHGYLIREAIVKHEIMPKVLRLLGRREKHLVLDAIRLVRVCIGLKEKFFVDYIVQHNLLSPIVRVFVSNGSKNNLINSAIVELFECVKDSREPVMASLVEYIVTSFSNELRPMRAYASTFKELERKLDDIRNGPRSPTTQSPPSSAGSAAEGLAKRSSLFIRSSAPRVTANSLFGTDTRPFRVSPNPNHASHAAGGDEDEALFADEDSSSSAASASDDDPSPLKRARLDLGGVDSKRVSGGGPEATSPVAGD